jgi:ubiquinone/menaquinone biosynthesis C-methylase UbiE
VGNSATYLIPHLRPGQRVLDIGCGPGTITIDPARAVVPGSVVGIDSKPAPLKEARADADAQGVRNVSFAVGDVYQLNYADDTDDLAPARCSPGQVSCCCHG